MAGGGGVISWGSFEGELLAHWVRGEVLMVRDFRLGKWMGS